VKTSDKDGKTLATLLMSAWQEYQDNGYPKDPRCYVVRAAPKTAVEMRQLQLSYKFARKTDPFYVEDSFLGFRLEEDPHLRANEVIFGPETVRIEWSRR